MNIRQVTKNGKKMWMTQLPTGKRYSNGRPKYQAVFRDTKQEVQSYILDFRFVEKTPKDRRVFFGEISHKYVEFLRNEVRINKEKPMKGIRAATLEEYYNHIIFINKLVGEDTDIQLINVARCRELKQKLEEYSDRKAAKSYQQFTRIMDMAVEEELILTNPAKAIKAPKVVYVGQAAPEEEEMKKFISYNLKMTNINDLRKKQRVLFFYLMAITGCRAGEALAARPCDFNKGQFLIRRSMDKYGNINLTKSAGLRKDGQGHRVVPMSMMLTKMIEEYIERNQFQPEERIFSVTLRGMKHWMERCCDVLRIRRLNFRDFRRYFATQSYKFGVTAKEVQLRLGHKVEQTQDTYITYQDPNGVDHANNLEKELTTL